MKYKDIVPGQEYAWARGTSKSRTAVRVRVVGPEHKHLKPFQGNSFDGFRIRFLENAVGWPEGTERVAPTREIRSTWADELINRDSKQSVQEQRENAAKQREAEENDDRHAVQAILGHYHIPEPSFTKSYGRLSTYTLTTADMLRLLKGIQGR